MIRKLIHNPVGKRNISPKEKEAVKKYFNYKCCECKKKLGSNSLEVDHKKAVALSKRAFDFIKNYNLEMTTKDGRAKKHSYDYKNNLVPLCKNCHKKKTKKDMEKIGASRKKQLDPCGVTSIDTGV